MHSLAKTWKQTNNEHQHWTCIFFSECLILWNATASHLFFLSFTKMKKTIKIDEGKKNSWDDFFLSLFDFFILPWRCTQSIQCLPSFILNEIKRKSHRTNGPTWFSKRNNANNIIRILLFFLPVRLTSTNFVTLNFYITGDEKKKLSFFLLQHKWRVKKENTMNHYNLYILKWLFKTLIREWTSEWEIWRERKKRETPINSMYKSLNNRL